MSKRITRITRVIVGGGNLMPKTIMVTGTNKNNMWVAWR